MYDEYFGGSDDSLVCHDDFDILCCCCYDECCYDEYPIRFRSKEEREKAKREAKLANVCNSDDPFPYFGPQADCDDELYDEIKSRADRRNISRERKKESKVDVYLKDPMKAGNWFLKNMSQYTHDMLQYEDLGNKLRREQGKPDYDNHNNFFPSRQKPHAPYLSARGNNRTVVDNACKSKACRERVCDIKPCNAATSQVLFEDLQLYDAMLGKFSEWKLRMPTAAAIAARNSNSSYFAKPKGRNRKRGGTKPQLRRDLAQHIEDAAYTANNNNEAATFDVSEPSPPPTPTRYVELHGWFMEPKEIRTTKHAARGKHCRKRGVGYTLRCNNASTSTVASRNPPPTYAPQPVDEFS